MEKLSKGFFGGEVLICGCSSKDNVYYKRLYKHFTANGIEVVAMPTEPASELGFETCPDFDALPGTPHSAYVLSHKTRTPRLVEQLHGLGVRNILFYGKACADEATVADCESKGMSVRFGCPLTLFAGGPCWLHAAFTGLLRERKK